MALWRTSGLQQHASEPGTSTFLSCHPLTGALVTGTLASEQTTTNKKQPTHPVLAVVGSRIAFSIVYGAIPLCPPPPFFKYF